MKLALIGYGKMGKAIEKIAVAKGHEVVYKTSSPDLDESLIKKADVAIEFTAPDSAKSNILKCFQWDIPVVVGTTGWYNDYDFICNQAELSKGGLFTATNFSIGVNLFFELNKKLAIMMNNYPEYDSSMEEIHHLQKLDHPSGTGITLAEGIIENIDRKKKWVGQLEGNTIEHDDVDLNILSKREPEVPGTHKIKYSSEIDEIEIIHTAKSRVGFASGALMAAEWMVGKQGVYGMKNLLNIN